MVHFPNLITETNYLYKFLKDHLTQTAEKLCICHFPQVKDNCNDDPSQMRVLFALELYALQAHREYNIEMYKCTTIFLVWSLKADGGKDTDRLKSCFL